ncbi:MAG TPA: 4-hydroxybenzoyl-CoA reductase subunit alpha [Hyphomicrobiaceae bacterium]
MNEIVAIHPIGGHVPMVDGPDKVSGRARYTADFIAPGMLAGRIYRSPYAHAEIVEVDVSEAAKVPGVVAIVTGADCDKPFGVLPIARSEHALARGKVRYKGEPVAAVAAVDEATADRAVRRIRMKVRELPAYFTAADALAPDAVPLHEKKPGNIERDVHFELGSVAEGFAAADLVREAVYNCAEVCQNQMEMHAAVAEYDPVRDRMTVHASTQVPYYVHLMLAQILDMDMARIRVVKPFVGGGFGCRTECLNVELIAALLARKAGGAVRIVLNREDTFITHRGRPETDIRLKLGLTNAGRITAAECECIQRGGAHSGYGVVTILYAGSMLYAIYDLHNVKYIGRRVLTNTPPCGAFRGHGTVDVRFAFESLLDQVAREMGLDPMAVRRANFLEAPTRTDNDLMVNSYGLPECIDWVERESGWKQRRGRLASPGNGKRKGLGFACSHYISGASKPVNWTGEPHATVKLKLDFDGSIVVLTGAADIGQGSSTILVQTVAEVLGLDISRVRIVSGDSEVVPKDNGSYSSRVTFIVGNAAIDAANKLKGLLVAAAARKLEAAPDDIECLGEVYRAGAQDKGLTFQEVVAEALKDEGTITVTGTYSTIPESHGGKKYRGAAIGGTMGYSYSAQVVEVTVDEETGEVTVDKVWVAHDCGRALNRLTVEGQVQGSVWMGMGQAMSEEAGYHDGLLVTANMLDYRVPTIQDSPPIEVGIVESNDPHGPFGAKEAGEGSLAAFLPALTNAIADATGLRFDDLPVTPDRVFAAIERRARAESDPSPTDRGQTPRAHADIQLPTVEARGLTPFPAGRSEGSDPVPSGGA